MKAAVAKAASIRIVIVRAFPVARFLERLFLKALRSREAKSRCLYALLVGRCDFAAAIAIADMGVEELPLGGRGIEVGGDLRRHVLVDVDAAGDEGDRQP